MDALLYAAVKFAGVMKDKERGTSKVRVAEIAQLKLVTLGVTPCRWPLEQWLCAIPTNTGLRSGGV
jgi:hypothetical protein